MRKSLMKVVAVLLIAGLLAGCSTAELGYFNMQREISSLKVYENTGEISVVQKQLPAELINGADAEGAEMLQKSWIISVLVIVAKWI